MRSATWFRIAGVVMLLFAAGHTTGFLTFRPATAEGQAVWAAMNGVHFTVGRQTFSYGGFYVGLGLSCTAAMLFQAWLTWQIALMADRGMVEARSIGWAFCALQVVSIGLSLRYFAAAPAVLSVVEAGCYAMGAMRMGRHCNPVSDGEFDVAARNVGVGGFKAG